MSIIDKKLEYFIAVVEEGSFSAAAKKKYVSQANLSKQMAQLEAELGVEIFDRSGYRPVLTDAGSFLFDKAQRIIAQENEIYDGLRQFIPGSVKAGFTGVFENRELIEAVRAFQEVNPDNEIEMSRFDLEECAKALSEGQVDVRFGLESTFKRYKDVKHDVLHGYDICFICTLKHPLAQSKTVSVEQIKNEEMVILSKKFSVDYYNDFMDSCRKDGYKPNVKKEVDSFDELILSVCLNEGVALCGESSIREEGLVAIPLECTNHSPNYVVAYRNEHHKANVELFLEYIRKYFLK